LVRRTGGGTKLVFQNEYAGSLSLYSILRGADYAADGLVDFFSIPGVQIGGVAGLVVTLSLLVIRGFLIPRTTYKELKLASDEAIKRLTDENRDWKNAWLLEQQSRVLRDRQFDTLIEISKTTQELVRANQRGVA